MSQAEADRLKNEGNEFFKHGKYNKAIDFYTQALEHSRTPALLCNRAIAYLKIELPGAAMVDADEAIGLDRSFIKAYYRKATAHIELGKFKDALKDLKVVVSIVPDDADAQAKLAACEKTVKQMAFLNAIASPDSLPASKMPNRQPDKIPVPSSYDGPRVEGAVLTQTFVSAMAKQFEEEKLICERDLVFVLLQALGVLSALPNVVSIAVPDSECITVCGDTHGQYYDLLNIFKLNGLPSPANRYLFNGDFVDRGSYSLENVTLLLAYKALYPEHVFLSRGNHEGLSMNRVYGFQGEVKAKYNDDVFNLFSEVFCALPIAHVINKQVFVTHGGLYSKDNVTIEMIQAEKRFREIPEDGLFCESLWADPQPFNGRSPSKRGVGLAFGPDVTENFLKTNGLSLVVRSHEVKEEGYVVEHNGKCITVFSAPNYCDQMGNKGAFIQFRGDTMEPKFTSFMHVQHPGKRPMQYSGAMGNFM